MPSPARRAQYPARWWPWLDDVPKQERDEDAVQLSAALSRLGAVGGRDRCELVVTHNFVIGWFVSQVLQTPVSGWMDLNSANCGLTILTWASGQTPKVVTFNDTGHL